MSIQEQNSEQIARIPVSGSQDVVLARFVARQQAELIGMEAISIIRFSTAVSELARNIVQHSQSSGYVAIAKVQDGSKVGLKTEAKDAGIGLTNTEELLRQSKDAQAGGIFGAMSFADSFDIESSAGNGTRAILVKWV